MSKVKITVINNNGRESHKRFRLRPETWKKQEKKETEDFLGAALEDD